MSIPPQPNRAYDVYPGTTTPVGPPATERGRPGGFRGWDEDPIYKRVDGYLREFFGISHLANALQRSPKTIYKWERAGLFPRPTFVYNGASRHGQRRLYTRFQVDGVVRIAVDEGILQGTNRYLGETLFPTKTAEFFRTTKGILPPPIEDWNQHG